MAPTLVNRLAKGSQLIAIDQISIPPPSIHGNGRSKIATSLMVNLQPFMVTLGMVYWYESTITSINLNHCMALKWRGLVVRSWRLATKTTIEDWAVLDSWCIHTVSYLSLRQVSCVSKYISESYLYCLHMTSISLITYSYCHLNFETYFARSS